LSKVLDEVEIVFQSLEADFRVSAFNGVGIRSAWGSTTLLTGQDCC
jgi:hypothetical protein